MVKKMREDLKKEILETLEILETPVNITYIAKKFNLSWHVARQILFELCAEGKLEAIKTTGPWVFKVKIED